MPDNLTPRTPCLDSTKPAFVNKIFYYDPDMGPVYTALHFSHTLLPLIVKRPSFWVFLLVHVCVFFAHQAGYIYHVDDSKDLFYIDWHDIKVVTAITAFFQVFYTNQVFARYLHIYSSTRAMLGHVLEICLELRMHMRGNGLQQHAFLAGRYMITSMILFFWEMNRSLTDAEWRQLSERGLVMPEERLFLEGFGTHQTSLIVLTWCADVFQAGHTKMKLNTNVLNNFLSSINKTRAVRQEVIDTLTLPVPFQYFHLLNMMVCVNLMLWGYGMGITDSVFAPVVYICAEFILLGILKLAAQLTDPFGPDEVDFPMQTWMHEFVQHALLLLQTDSPLSENKWTKALEKERLIEPRMADVSLFFAHDVESSPSISIHGPRTSVISHSDI